MAQCKQCTVGQHASTPGQVDCNVCPTDQYNDEIGHVLLGSQWFFYQCKQRDLDPRATFTDMVERHLHGQLRGPFNIAARLQAGFDEIEMAALNSRFG